MSESMSVKIDIVPLASIEETDDISTATIHNSFVLEQTNNKPQTPKQLYQNAYFDSCHSFSSSIFSPAGDAPEFVNDSFVTKIESNENNHNYVTADEDYGDTGFFSSSSISMSSKQSSIDFSSIQKNNGAEINDYEDEDDDDEDALIERILYDKQTTCQTPKTPFNSLADQSSVLSSNSLENLVNNFDESVRTCLKDFEKNVAEVAPVQMRSEEEVICQRPAWWTLTGEYGNILPIDWSAVAQQTLDSTSAMNSLISLDESISSQFNVQQILSDIQNSSLSGKNADEVLEEIEALLSNSESLCLDSTSDSTRNDFSIKPITFYRFSLEKLKNLQLDQLQDLCEDLETRTQEYSQELIQELASRDELEFEKETKSTFIDLLIQVHNTRREFIECDFNQVKTNGSRKRVAPIITTTIPYPKDSVTNNVPVLQALNKLMKSMLEDNPAISTLLTDYILKHVCPTEQCHSKEASTSGTVPFSESASKIYKSVHRNSLRLLNRT